MRHRDAAVQTVGEARDDVPGGVDLDAAPAHRRARDRHGGRVGPLHVGRGPTALGQDVPGTRPSPCAVTPVVPARARQRPARRGGGQRPGGRRRRCRDLLDQGEARDARDRVRDGVGVGAGRRAWPCTAARCRHGRPVGQGDAAAHQRALQPAELRRSRSAPSCRPAGTRCARRPSPGASRRWSARPGSRGAAALRRSSGR